MAQNITLLGASYSDVPAVELPKTGGGIATFIDVTDVPTKTSDLTNDGDDGVNAFVAFDDAATSSTYGLVKTNPNEGVTLNADGQLDVGGRLGQFPNGGLFYPTNSAPTNVGASSLLMSDAKGLSAVNRNVVVAGGNNITLKSSHVAGSTTYRIKNDYYNRIVLTAAKGGRATLSAETAIDYTVPILSVKFANGNDISPYSGALENNNDIIVTTDGSANPNSSASSLRFYGTWGTTDIISCGQFNGSSGGKTLQVGMNCRSESNQCIQIGNGIYSSGNNSAQFGRHHINKKTDSLLAGYGHDNSNGSQGSSAVGLFSEITSTTAFAVGNGTSNIERSNALEVTTDGGIVLKSPNGTKYKITVDNSGNLTTTAVS